MKRTLIIILAFCCVSSFAQSLFENKNYKIGSKKKSIFVQKGIFHNGGAKGKSMLKAVRHFYTNARGYERIVFDFTTDYPPRIYGHLAPNERKIYIDFFDTANHTSGRSFGQTRFVEEMKVFPFSGDSLAIELNFNNVVSADIFTLNSPGRLVIDVKKN